jgi:hypothetical protein
LTARLSTAGYAALSLSLLGVAGPIHAQGTPAWSEQFPPFRIVGALSPTSISAQERPQPSLSAEALALLNARGLRGGIVMRDAASSVIVASAYTDSALVDGLLPLSTSCRDTVSPPVPLPGPPTAQPLPRTCQTARGPRRFRSVSPTCVSRWQGCRIFFSTRLQHAGRSFRRRPRVA